MVKLDPNHDEEQARSTRLQQEDASAPQASQLERLDSQFSAVDPRDLFIDGT